MFDCRFESPTSGKDIGRMRIANCDKDGAIVAARIAGAMGGIASGRPLAIRIDRYTDERYFEEMANRLAGYYDRVPPGSLLSDRVVVLSSVHRAALYVAETLHARLLPLQLLSFSRNLNEAMRSPMLGILGAGHGVRALWQWNKIADPAHFPARYRKMIEAADDLVVVRSTDDGSDAPIEGRIGHIYVNRTLQRLNPECWEVVRPVISTSASLPELGQWEWGLPNATVEACHRLWCELGKPPERFHLIEAGTVALYRRVPRLWETYLQRNGKPIQGVALNAYWIAHPTFERICGVVPIPFYRFSTVRQVAEKYLVRVPSVGDGKVCAFTNRIGGCSDPEEIRELLRKHGLTQHTWFSIGIDAPDAQCRNVFGQPIPQPAEKAAEWAGEQTFDLGIWDPLDVSFVVEQMNRA